MITKISHTGVFVFDQDIALDFYTNVLGMEVRVDAPMGKHRWLTVSPKNQPEIELILMPVAEEMGWDKKSADQIRDLVKNSKLGGPILECNDIYQTYDELKNKGVEFLKPPTKEFYKIEALFKDPFGNMFSLGQIETKDEIGKS